MVPLMPRLIPVSDFPKSSKSLSPNTPPPALINVLPEPTRATSPQKPRGVLPSSSSVSMSFTSPAPSTP